MNLRLERLEIEVNSIGLVSISIVCICMVYFLGQATRSLAVAVDTNIIFAGYIHDFHPH